MLVAAPGLQCGDTTYKYIEIREGVNADFSFQNQCVQNPFQFTDMSAALDGTLASWQWTFGDGGSSSQQNPSHSYINSGNFNVTLTAYNSYGCSEFVTKQVTVFAIPIVNAGPDTFICNVDSVTLHADNGANYSWQPNYNINNTSSQNPVVDPKVTTVYLVTVTNANGCKSIDSVTIQVTDTVIASAWPDTIICEGELVQLQAEGAVYYIWQPDQGLNNALISNPVASPASTTMYIVDSYIGSCVDQDTLLITVLPRPIPDAGPDVTINQGETTQLNATGGENYLWQPPDALSDPNIFNPVANPLNTITYTVNSYRSKWM
jgi:PKD repeat protein